MPGLSHKILRAFRKIQNVHSRQLINHSAAVCFAIPMHVHARLCVASSTDHLLLPSPCSDQHAAAAAVASLPLSHFAACMASYRVVCVCVCAQFSCEKRHRFSTRPWPCETIWFPQVCIVNTFCCSLQGQCAAGFRLELPQFALVCHRIERMFLVKVGCVITCEKGAKFAQFLHEKRRKVCAIFGRKNAQKTCEKRKVCTIFARKRRKFSAFFVRKLRNFRAKNAQKVCEKCAKFVQLLHEKRAKFA